MRASPEIPSRLRQLVAADRAHPLRQPPVTFDSRRWTAALGDRRDVLEGLPRQLDRASLREYALAQPHDGAGAIAAFIVSQVWGYGGTQYGPYRLGESLHDPNLAYATQAARLALEYGDPVDAFEILCVESAIPYVGLSFGSKFLYVADPHGRAVILDRLVRAWLQDHAGLRFPGRRDAVEYARWLELAGFWADQLDVAPGRLEMLIFTDALPAGSSWAAESSPGN